MRLMNMNHKRRMLLGLLLIIVLLMSSVFAYATLFKGEVSIKNLLNTGSVDINLSTWQITDDGERKAEPVDEIAANQDISFIPRVTSNRTDCYVRVTMDVVMDKEIPVPITDKNIVNLNKDWVQCDNVFYYKNILKVDDTTDLFDGIHIPEEWANENSSNFTVNLTADAIQSDELVPDFSSDAPWGSVQIEESKESDDIDYHKVTSVKDVHKLTYKGNSVFEVSSKDFFSNFEYMMPGESFVDKIRLNNSGDNDIKLLFKSTVPKDDLLLEKIKLKILIDNKLFYEGDLKAAKLSNYKELVRISSGNSVNMAYELDIPEELKNEYSAEKDHIIWQFKAVEIDDKGNPVKTGDTMNILLYIFTGIVALLLIIYFVLNRKKKG